MIRKLYELLLAHAITDYALQGAWMAQEKQAVWSDNWAWILGAHGVVNGAGVYYVTGSIWLSVGEIIVHSLIDYMGMSTGIDQALHMLSKIMWVIIWDKWGIK